MNPDQVLKLSEEEQKIRSEISAIARVSEEDVTKVFQAFFMIFYRKIRDKENRIQIPYLFDIAYDYDIVEENSEYILKEKFDVKPSEALHEIMVNVKNGKRLWLHKFYVAVFRKIISQLFNLQNKYIESQVEQDLEKFVYANRE